MSEYFKTFSSFRNFLKHIYFLTVIFLSIFSNGLGATVSTGSTEVNLENRITKLLTNRGFENVKVSIVENDLLIEYENRIYRDEITAIKRIVGLITQDLEGRENLVIVPYNRTVPLAVVSFPLNEYVNNSNGNTATENIQSAVDVSIDVNSFMENYQFKKKNLPSYRNIELIFNSRVRGLFHTRAGVAQWNVDFAPALSITFAQGTQLMVEGLFPLYYQFNQQDKEIKLGRVILNHTRRFPHNIWLSTSIGAFDRDRYGISTESIKFWMNGKFFITARLDYSGYLNYHERTWYYSALNHLSYWGGLNYRFSKVDFLIRIGWGSYLMGDKAWKIDILRSFGEFDLGFYSFFENLFNPSEYFSGIYFRIPLPFFRSNIHKYFSVRSQQYFYWGVQPHSDATGRFLKSENYIEKYQKNLFPSYFKNNFYN